VIGNAVREFTVSGEGAVLAFADYGRAVLCNGLGRYQEALTAAAATDALEDEGVTIVTQGLAELVEAAVRAGAPERAADALARLEEMTRASDTGWGAGVRARSQALVSADDAAEPLYREAIERLGGTRIRPQLARAHLVYGEAPWNGTCARSSPSSGSPPADSSTPRSSNRLARRISSPRSGPCPRPGTVGIAWVTAPATA